MQPEAHFLHPDAPPFQGRSSHFCEGVTTRLEAPAHREGDPHLTLAHGGEADFRGCDDCLFNFLSTDDLVVNARTKDATFRRLSNATTNKQQRASIQPEEGTWQAPPSTGWL